MFRNSVSTTSPFWATGIKFNFFCIIIELRNFGTSQEVFNFRHRSKHSRSPERTQEGLNRRIAYFSYPFTSSRSGVHPSMLTVHIQLTSIAENCYGFSNLSIDREVLNTGTTGGKQLCCSESVHQRQSQVRLFQIDYVEAIARTVAHIIALLQKPFQGCS